MPSSTIYLLLNKDGTKHTQHNCCHAYLLYWINSQTLHNEHKAAVNSELEPVWSLTHL